MLLRFVFLPCVAFKRTAACRVMCCCRCGVSAGPILASSFAQEQMAAAAYMRQKVWRWQGLPDYIARTIPYDRLCTSYADAVVEVLQTQITNPSLVRIISGYCLPLGTQTEALERL